METSESKRLLLFLYIAMLSGRIIVGKTVVKGSKIPPGEEFRFEALYNVMKPAPCLDTAEETFATPTRLKKRMA